MKRKALVTITLTAGFVMAAAITSMAGEWKQNAAGWWWEEDNGFYPTNTWMWLDGNKDGISECYYFNEQGYLLTDTVTPDAYTVNGDGAWTVDGVVQTRTENTQAEQAQAEQTQSAVVSGVAAVSSGVPKIPVMEDSTCADKLVLRDNSEYYDRYAGLQPGKAYIYDNLSGLEVAVLDFDFFCLQVEMGSLYTSLEENADYLEWDLFDASGAPIGRYAKKENTSAFGEEGNGYVRIFSYY